MITICNIYSDKYITGILFCIGYQNIKIFIIVKNTGIQDFKFRFVFGTKAVFLNEVADKEMPVVDICTGIPYNNVSEYYPDDNTILSRLRHDCPDYYPNQIIFLSVLHLSRSRVQ